MRRGISHARALVQISRSILPPPPISLLVLSPRCLLPPLLLSLTVQCKALQLPFALGMFFLSYLFTAHMVHVDMRFGPYSWSHHASNFSFKSHLLYWSVRTSPVVSVSNNTFPFWYVTKEQTEHVPRCVY